MRDPGNEVDTYAHSWDTKLNTKSLGHRFKIEVLDKQHGEEKTNLFISQTLQELSKHSLVTSN